MHRLGFDLKQAAAAVGQFSGAGRRFDLRGTAGGVTAGDLRRPEIFAQHPFAGRGVFDFGDQRDRIASQGGQHRRTGAVRVVRDGEGDVAGVLGRQVAEDRLDVGRAGFRPKARK